MLEKEEKHLEYQREIIAKLDTLIGEARKIKHNIFRCEMQLKDRCPEVKKSGESFKAFQKSYRKTAIDFDRELDRQEALLQRLNVLKIEKEKSVKEVEEAEQKLTQRGRQEWQKYMAQYFSQYPEKKARYEAYLAAGGKPLEW